MEKEIKKRELTYHITGALLAVFVVGTMIYGIWFVTHAFDVALNPNLIAPLQAVTFNLDLAKQLQLLK